MTPRTNMLLFGATVIAGLTAAAFAYHHPSSITPATEAAISALGIIFGLSAAVASFLGVVTDAPVAVTNDPHLARQIVDTLKEDDRKAATRQKWLNVVALLAVIFGLMFLVATDIAAESAATRGLCAGFTFLSILSLLSALRLPGPMATLVARRHIFKDAQQTRRENAQTVKS